MSRCSPAGHKGHTDPSAGPRSPRAPPRAAPSPRVLVSEDRRVGVAALSSWLGRARAASHALPDLVPTAPLHGLSQYAGHPPILYVEA